MIERVLSMKGRDRERAGAPGRLEQGAVVLGAGGGGSLTKYLLSLSSLTSQTEPCHPTELGVGGWSHSASSDRRLAQGLAPRRHSGNASLPASSTPCLLCQSPLLEDRGTRTQASASPICPVGGPCGLAAIQAQR